MSQANLVLHVGARRVSREELAQAPCPEPEGRWRPVPHIAVLDAAAKALTDAGYGIEKEDLGLWRDSRFFGTLTLKAPVGNGVNLAVGIRSSTDRSIALQWCCGSRVFVCDNLAFSSQVVIARKHTTHGATRFQEAICRAVADLPSYQDYERFKVQQMRDTPLTDEQAESILLRAFEHGIIGPRALPVAIDEWRQPSWPQEFGSETAGKTAWRCFNALTFALGRRVQTNPQAHATATIRLGRLLLPEAPAAAAN